MTYVRRYDTSAPRRHNAMVSYSRYSMLFGLVSCLMLSRYGRTAFFTCCTMLPPPYCSYARTNTTVVIQGASLFGNSLARGSTVFVVDSILKTYQVRTKQLVIRLTSLQCMQGADQAAVVHRCCIVWCEFCLERRRHTQHSSPVDDRHTFSDRYKQRYMFARIAHRPLCLLRKSLSTMLQVVHRVSTFRLRSIPAEHVRILFRLGLMIDHCAKGCRDLHHTYRPANRIFSPDTSATLELELHAKIKS